MKSVNAWHSRKWNYWAHRQPEWLVTSQREPRLVSGFTSELKLKRDVRAADHGWLPDEIFSRVDRLTTLCHDLPAFGWWAVWGSLATAWALLFCLHHLKKKKGKSSHDSLPFWAGFTKQHDTQTTDPVSDVLSYTRLFSPGIHMIIVIISLLNGNLLWKMPLSVTSFSLKQFLVGRLKKQNCIMCLGEI